MKLEVGAYWLVFLVIAWAAVDAFGWLHGAGVALAIQRLAPFHPRA